MARPVSWADTDAGCNVIRGTEVHRRKARSALQLDGVLIVEGPWMGLLMSQSLSFLL